jgi:hypothetical protein
MKVFKIENKMGHGPYSAEEAKSEWMDHPHLDGEHPLLMDESLCEVKTWIEQNKGYSMDDFVSGFMTLDQLERWFSPRELIKLNQEGFQIVEKEALVVFALEKQVAYIPR